MDKGLELGLPVDTLRNGLQQVRNEIENVHPLQHELKQVPLFFILKLFQHQQKEKRQKYFTLSHVYGSSMPMKMEMEKQLVSHSLRLPGLDSARIGLDVLTNDISFGFEDYLNRKLL
jgi:proteasome maturation protein